MEFNDIDFSMNKEKSKKQVVYEIIKEKIITYDLKPGTMLVERQLCALLNTSRTPIREAIQQLTVEGLVCSFGSQGSMVSEIRYEDIARTYDVREYLEGLAARLCAQTITESEIKELEKYLDNMTQYIRDGHFLLLFDADNTLHSFIVHHSHNNLLEGIFDTNLNGHIRRMTRLIDGNAQGIVDAHIHHQELVTAIKNHDAELAEKVMREHIRNSKLSHLKLFAPNIVSSTL